MRFRASTTTRRRRCCCEAATGSADLYHPVSVGRVGFAARELGEGRAELERCLELNPNFDNAMTGLARRIGEARAWRRSEKLARQGVAEQSAELPWRGIRRTARRRKRSKSAQSAYEKTIAIQPNFSAGQREIGMLLFRAEEYRAAAPHLEKAIDLGLDDARCTIFWESATTTPVGRGKPCRSLSRRFSLIRGWRKLTSTWHSPGSFCIRTKPLGRST
jgi:tetratricopeptide (TPR) repeat protein